MSEWSWFGRHKVLTTVIAVVTFFVVLGTAGGEEPRGRSARPTPTVSVSATPESPASGVPASASPPPAPGTFLVSEVVDGDTVRLANGETVRLVGIDTPERGQCGYEKAGAHLSRLVLGERVRLRVADEDRDGYARLLRYVDVGGTDTGLRLVRRGLAVARYDSRDGYGHHPREERYVAADAGSPEGCPKGAPLVPRRSSVGDGQRCAVGYSPCVPPYGPDLDCADLVGPIRVAGSDPHRLDADDDGRACE